MKLFFDKKENGDICVTIQKGTVTEQFSYLEMLKQLLEDNNIEEPNFTNFEEEEKNKIRELLNKIKVEVEKSKQIQIDE